MPAGQGAGGAKGLLCGGHATLEHQGGDPYHVEAARAVRRLLGAAVIPSTAGRMAETTEKKTDVLNLRPDSPRAAKLQQVVASWREASLSETARELPRH